MSAGGETLSLVPPPGPPISQAPTGPIVLLGLIYTGGPRPLELAFCSEHDNQGMTSFFVRPGAKSARCPHCKARHRVIGLLEAAGTFLLGDEAGPCLSVKDLLEPMYRELLARARAGASETESASPQREGRA